MDLEQLRALAAVVDQETFEAAADELRITPSAVSQRIKALERSVGSVLVRRLKPVVPTPAGERLLRSARQLLLLADEALLALRSDQAHDGGGRASSGAERLRVPIVANADSIATWLPPALREIALGGRVAVELLRDDEHATADLLRSGDAVGAITADPRPVQGCRVQRLGTMVYRAKGSEEFIRRWFPDGPTPDALAAAPVMQYDRKDSHQLALLARVAPEAVPPQHFIPDSVQYVEAVRAGLGWGMVPDQQDPEGSLVELDPAWSEDLELYWQSWTLDSPGLDEVSAAVVRAAAVLREARRPLE
ncbi:transcriptional regulator ArgP [Sinomonas cellulolyticus]|uniref:ArgP/LysG family DNA-binding transcriptional regulator n=1 Tax=Sinomonas cellulolyticus TaxID=2801916 RepID=A0ABS1K6G4_9MICC|nr:MULTISPECIES: ArgP/LysG family DNA-binding transcriptional regulator [Sinomonas]MBL0707043.1 ArgP/LysG family DNA-binding transcriptional regulator [Sinomonas cellulolyticus]GHG54352.1 transcriptional regulator ArgP [Sinomonas sp. KCTC 49339]